MSDKEFWQGVVLAVLKAGRTELVAMEWADRVLRKAQKQYGHDFGKQGKDNED